MCASARWLWLLRILPSSPASSSSIIFFSASCFRNERGLGQARAQRTVFIGVAPRAEGFRAAPGEGRGLFTGPSCRELSGSGWRRV